MNDLTLEELIILSQALNVAIFNGSKFYRSQYKEIKNKLKSLIDNHCEHNERKSNVNEDGHIIVECCKCQDVLWHEKD